MFKIFKNLKTKEVFLIMASVIFVVTQVYLDLKLPDYMKEITILIQSQGGLSEIWKYGAYMLLCSFGSLLSSLIVGFFAARISAAFSMRVRSKVFDKVQSFSMQEINNFSTASLITRSTNDITQVQMFIAMGMQVLIKAPILAVWAIVKIAGKSWQWTSITAGAVLILLVMVLVLMLFALPKFKKMQTLTDNLNRVTRENLTGARVVRAYNAEAHQEAKFEDANVALTNTQLFTSRMMAVLFPVISFIMSGISLGIYWVGAYLIDSANLIDKMAVFGDMIVFSSYAMQVIMAFMMLVMVFILLPRASVSAKRLNEVLDTKPSIVSGEFNGETQIKGEVEFKNVTFKYPFASDAILENISFKASRGETVAFIGSTGSGKTTLINLIPRFYDVTDGEVLVDGVNVKDYETSKLNNKIGYVSQKAVLFSGTVASNVAYGENGKEKIDDDKIKKAIEVAQSKDFVEKMRGGYDGAISQGGANVSGGQKQRLSIARAIARDPEIYIFDDTFSALDYKTDKTLRNALNDYVKGATNLIIAQRIGTIKNADKIIVLDEGKICGMGKHKELLKTCAVYKQIALSQLSEEELENE